ncbi:MAG TPA: multicopper oxidase domain-containing protein [Pyrinomonadaceae bacterium]|nr:multicopper oxidase domain-containing protein [Pyrinomonadaceae bacterium]
MADKRNITDQAEKPDHNESSSITEESGFTRRDFLQQTMAVASGLALGSVLPSYANELISAEPQACTGPSPGQGQPLQTIMEIKSAGSGTGPKTLQAVLKILDEQRNYFGNIAGTNTPSLQCARMRYISGYDMNNTSDVWPKIKGFPSPAPTLRVSVGDNVQITLVNNVNTALFDSNQLDVAEKGTTDTACAENMSDGVNLYPGRPTWETLPNCFHGSSSTNLHFHGTHISPSGIADNILINLRPSPRTLPAGENSKPLITEQTVAAMFKDIFAQCATKSPWPLLWSDWTPAWQNFQKTELVKYDNSAPWRGQNPPAGGPPVLPEHNRLWWNNQHLIDLYQLPQYYIGAFPYCFTPPKWNGLPTSMGQAPGTHWYHAHKHGSTAINLANGMAGALIIEGDYDAGLQSYYQSKGVNLKANEKVLVLQQISATVGLLRPRGTKDFVWVNGQYQPVIEMRPNETQFWRIINTCHQQAVPLDQSNAIKWVQTAQDGIQLDPQNYNPDPNFKSNTFPNPPQAFQVNGTGPWFSTGSLAPGNRIDLLVQAPSTANNYPVTFGGTLLFTVKVTGTAVPAVPFPTQAQFPKMPGFLSDIVPPTGMVVRNIRFNTTKTQFASPTPTPTPQGTQRGRNPSNAPPPLVPNAPPTHTINGKQFSGEIDQYMKLGATEEWNLFNDSITGGPVHPFHIHVNPFQIVRWFDPAIMAPSLRSTGVPMRSPWVWWDNFAIPVQGWVTMWTRFVDFTGTYVFHCHILGHEDRGMMQLVNVSPAVTPMAHE